MVVTVKGVTDDGLDGATTFTINNEKRERQVSLQWKALHPEQLQELAKLGGSGVGASDYAIAAAYEALASGDFDGVERELQAAERGPLFERLSRLAREGRTRRAYEKAMARAKELAGRKRYESALAACAKALQIVPGDAAATALRDEVNRLFDPAAAVAAGVYANLHGTARLRAPVDEEGEFPPTRSVTLAAWLWRDRVPEWNYLLAVGKPNDGDGYGLIGYQHRLVLRLGVGGHTFRSRTEERLVARRWTHVAAVVDRESSTATLYINGTPRKLRNHSMPGHTRPVTRQPLVIGGTGVEGTRNDVPWGGNVTRVAVYSRVLNAEEIAELMRGAPPKKGLAAYWKLDELSGPRRDSSGNGNHLEVLGTVRAGGAAAKAAGPRP
jgi:hypothetical protein